MNFEIIEHTGDVGIRYFGSTLNELISSAVSGTAYVIGDPGPDCARSREEFSITFSDYSDLLIQLIDRMIYNFEVNEVLFDTVEELNLNGKKAIVTISGCTVDKGFQYRYILKAPTYHKMEINLDEGYGVQIFDI